MEIEFEGDIWYWRGPSPFYFVTVPEAHCEGLRDMAGLVSYGWGVVPALIRIGNTEWTTSLFPKDGKYIVPVKALVRRAEKLEEGDTVTLRLRIAT